MHRLFDRWRQSLVLAGCAVALVAPLLPHRSAADELRTSNGAETAARPGILLMRNGKVVEGRILKSGDDYTVQQPSGGTMFVPGTLVSLHCENVREALLKLRDNARRQNAPGAHCTLARWCITNQLLSEAREELDQALQLDAGCEEARNLLLRLNELLDPQRSAESKKTQAPDPLQSAPKPQKFAADDAESLGSLTREQAQQFTRRIQPILINNCAVAGCHGADSETGFRLQRVIPGGDTSRIASERNLAEVLDQLDYKSPRSSPLLSRSRGAHGRHRKPLFAGPRGAEQHEDLRKWVQSVARSTPSRDRRDGSLPQATDAVEQVSGIAERETAGKPSRRTAKPAPERNSRGDASPRSATDPFQTRGQSDPFDPTAFNRNSAPRISGR
ncbi:MAG TPA: hypothetical protein VL475_00945 [Planctomycetaceae bacterium]|nr:hypothetical protein [Planctomycetaceae bacterium]